MNGEFLELAYSVFGHFMIFLTLPFISVYILKK